MRAHTNNRILRAAILALSLGSVAQTAGAVEAAGTADTGPSTQPARPPAAGQSRFLDPDEGQLDVSSMLEHAYGFLPVPLIVTEPAVGYGGGAAAMFVRPRQEIGQEGWARPNLSAVGGLGTENGTWMAFAADSSRWLDDRLQTVAAGGTGKINLDFYGAGLGLPQLDQGFRYSLVFTGAVAQANWKLAPKSPWALGLRYVYAGIKPQPHDENLLPDTSRSVTVSAPTAVLEYDSRNNLFTPTRGVFAETSYLIARSSLGATVNFERFQQVLLGWQPLPHQVTLGACASYAWASQGTPFFLRPYVQLRGVAAMRYQGDQAASLEVEARWQFTARWSVVPFAGLGATRLDRLAAPTDGQRVASGGLGLRYELARKFGLHAGLDLAHSPGPLWSICRSVTLGSGRENAPARSHPPRVWQAVVRAECRVP